MFCFFLLLALTILDTDARYTLFLPVLVSLHLCSRSLPPKKCFLGKNECTSFADFSLYLQKAKKKTRFLKNTTFFKRYLIDNIIIVILIVIMITINDNNNLIISKALHALINNPFTIHWKLNEKNMSVIDK